MAIQSEAASTVDPQKWLGMLQRWCPAVSPAELVAFLNYEARPMAVGDVPRSCSSPRTRPFILEMGRDGKFSAKSNAWEENKVIPKGEELVIKVKRGPLVHKSSRSRPPAGCLPTAR